MGKNISFFWIKQKYILKLSGRLLSGQNDFLDVLLLDEIALQFKKELNAWPIPLGANLTNWFFF